MANALQSNVFIVVYNSIFLGDFMLIIHNTYMAQF